MHSPSDSSGQPIECHFCSPRRRAQQFIQGPPAESLVTLAAATRRAVRATPFIRDALRAGVLNYTAAARFLDIGDEEAVAAALRRYGAELPAIESHGPDLRARVSMQSGLAHTEDPEDALLVIAETMLRAGDGDLTGLTITGRDVGPTILGRLIARLAAEELNIVATGGTAGVSLVIVHRRDGPDALRFVEAALEADPLG